MAEQRRLLVGDEWTPPNTDAVIEAHTELITASSPVSNSWPSQWPDTMRWRQTDPQAESFPLVLIQLTKD